MVDSVRIKRRMRLLQVTQAELAEAMGCATCTVSLKLHGKRPLMLSEALAIAQRLGIPMVEFAEWFMVEDA